MTGASDLLGQAPGEAVFDEMVDLRRAVHRRPELAFDEHATTALIKGHMGGLGIGQVFETGDTGGIFAMEGGRPGRSVVLRADIDALPVHEERGSGRPLRGGGRDARLRTRRPRGRPARGGHRAGLAAGGPAGPLRLPVPAGRGGPLRRPLHARCRCARASWRAPAWSAST